MKNNSIRYLFIWFSLLICTQFNFAQTKVNDTLSYIQKLRSGDYPPYVKLEEVDKIDLPLEFQIELNIDQLRDVDIKTTNFYIAFDYSISSKVDTLTITKNKDSILLDDIDDFFRIIYPEGDKNYKGGYVYDGRYYYELLKDTVTQWSSYLETELPHKWNLRDFPFDKQKLKIIFESRSDTSWVRLNPSIQFPPKIQDSDFEFLIDGLNVVDLTTEKKYVKTDIIGQDFIEGQRNEVYEQLIFNVEVDRNGSYLYFKLFFGGFLSFLISYLVFFIEPEYFETRITLSLGGIFGAVGNKYFVENSMPSIQVLTKADIINNAVIIFIILNVFIVIAQHTSKINLWKFEKNTFSASLILILFITSNFLIINL